MNEPAKAPLWPWLVGSLVLVSVVSAIGGDIATDSVRGWYRTLEKPALTPPNAVFPAVWTVLYVMMGIAAFLVFRAAGGFKPARVALGVYFVQLALNLAWTWLFFGLHDPFAAGVEVLVLAGAVGLTVALFWPFSRAAGILMLPYLAWTLFAAWLTWRIVALNP